MTLPSLRRWLAMIGAAGALFAATTAAQASDVHWSVGISAPIHHGAVSTVISSGPVWGHAPVYVAPAPVYVAPAPVYYAPPRHHYHAPVVRQHWGHGHGHGHGHWRGHGGHRHDGHGNGHGRGHAQGGHRHGGHR